jgi:uncharacterized protein
MFSRKTETYFRQSIRFVGWIIMFGVCLFQLQPASSQDIDPFSISVQAVGTATGMADRASMQFGVEGVGTNLQTSLEEVNNKVDAIVDALIELEIARSDIQITSVEIASEDMRDARTGALTGGLIYHVLSEMHVRLDEVDKLSAVIQAAITHGANSVSELALGITDLTELEQKAREAAIANAYVRAEALASGFQLSLDAPIVVSETIANDGLPVPLADSDIQWASFAAEEASSEIPFLVMTVHINVVFRTRPLGLSEDSAASLEHVNSTSDSSDS